jgi:SAM-dependent methyltransferase
MSEQALKVTAAAAGLCTACEKSIYAGIYHKCGEPYRLAGPNGMVVEVQEPPMPATSGVETFPPEVRQTTNRTQCERCGGALAPDVFHVCAQPAAPAPVGAVGQVQAEPSIAFAGSSVPAVPAVAGSEQEKYERMWAHEQYRAVSPGEGIAELFLKVAKPADGAHVIDFGCGTGRGALMLAIQANVGGIDLDVRMVDFAANCLDPGVREIMEAQSATTKTRLSFTQADLSKPLPPDLVAQYGFCTDVMEHIPPAQVDQVLANIMQAAQHVFLQIALQDDVCGALIGEALHLSVHDADWWMAKFSALGAQVHYSERDAQNLIVYATAWSLGQDVVDAGILNVQEDTIRAQVRANISAGWQQVVPHLPNNKEVLLLGGGPSLEAQYEEIKFLRERGAILVTMNGAYNWALEKGLSVSGTIVVDAREFNARFTHPAQEGVHYLISSQVHPSVLEGLPKERTFLWHTTAETIRDILQELLPDEWYGVEGGCTVLTRSIPLLRMLGYTKFHLFGCDSCLSEDGAHHAYAQPENDGVMTIPVIVGGRRFDCHAWQLAQATEFISLIKYRGELFDIEVHGGGLLAWILEHGAALEDQRELEESRKRAVNGMT